MMMHRMSNYYSIHKGHLRQHRQMSTTIIINHDSARATAVGPLKKRLREDRQVPEAVEDRDTLDHAEELQTMAGDKASKAREDWEIACLEVVTNPVSIALHKFLEASGPDGQELLHLIQQRERAHTNYLSSLREFIHARDHLANLKYRGVIKKIKTAATRATTQQ